MSNASSDIRAGDFNSIVGAQTIVDILNQYFNWVWKQGPLVEMIPNGGGFTCNVRSKGSKIIVGTGFGVTKKLAKESAGMAK